MFEGIFCTSCACEGLQSIQANYAHPFKSKDVPNTFHRVMSQVRRYFLQNLQLNCFNKEGGYYCSSDSKPHISVNTILNS